jgi:alkylmercury lyase
MEPMTAAIDIPALASELALADEVDARRRRLAIALLRSLAEGAPVAVQALAQRAELPLDAVRELLDAWPGLERDGAGRILGYGLTLRPTGHQLELDGTRLYAWCALDTLVFPLLLGAQGRVRSTPPSGGDEVRLEVDPGGVREISPCGAAMSLVRPSPSATTGGDLRGRFCCLVHFFASEADAQAWTARHEGTFVVSIKDGFELARRLVEGMSRAAPASRED